MKLIVKRKNGEIVKDPKDLVLPPELAKRIFEILNPHLVAIDKEEEK